MKNGRPQEVAHFFALQLLQKTVCFGGRCTDFHWSRKFPASSVGVYELVSVREHG